jgi:hypothetical protein
MKKALKRLIKQASSTGTSQGSSHLLMGGIDLITPSMINGWVWHPQHQLYDVRLLVGGVLVAASKIDVHRKDVVEKVGVDGHYGFSLRLPAQVLPIDLPKQIQVVALTADGTARFPLVCMKDKHLTQSLLKTALDLQYLGMEGNFDGLSKDGNNLTGWCTQSLRPGEICTIFLHAEGMDPVPVRCDKRRPGFAALGYPESCGFELRLDQLMSYDVLAGKRLYAAFDQSGLLPLPEALMCFLPSRSSAEDMPSSALAISEHSGDCGDDVLKVLDPAMFSGYQDLITYRAELEEFKKVCDVFEREIALRIQQEALEKQRKVGRFAGWRRLLGGKL